MGAQDSKQSWQELPFWNLVKNYIKCFLLGGLTLYLATRFGMWDITLANFHLQNMWLFIPETTVVLGAAYIWRWSRSTERKKRQKEAKQEMQTLIKEINKAQKEAKQ